MKKGYLFFRRSRCNYAENLTLQAFLGGFRVVFCLFIFTPLILLFREHYYTILTIYLGLWSVFLAWANPQFYGGRWWWVALKSILSLLLTQGVITVRIQIVLHSIV